MVDPEDANYKCTLTEYSLKKAKDELNEDPKERLGAVQALRKWIREQPHYTCRTDTAFILSILRRAKFSQLVARQLIDNIMSARTTCPEFLADIDTHEESMSAFLDSGYAFYLPKADKEGRRIMVMRSEAYDVKDPKRFNPVAETRLGMAMSEMLRDDENVSVNGYILFFDCTKLKMKHIQQPTMEENKKIMNIYQDCNPDRVKLFIFYNAGPLLEFLMTFAKTFFKKKNQERIRTFDNMESMYKLVPMELWPTEYLPDDYKGPSAGSMANIIADFKKQLMDPATRARILANSNRKYKIDESKRPAVSAPNESFRKLNVD